MNVFGKITNGIVETHSIYNPIINEDGSLLVTGDAEILLQYGYKKMIYTDAPVKEGYYAESKWVEGETEYTQEWTLLEEEKTIDETALLEERIAANEETTNMLLDCILEMSELLYA